MRLLFLLLAASLAPAMATEPSRLAGSSWTVVALGGTALETDNPPTMEFTTDGQITGNASCNGYGGPCVIEGDTLRISRLRATRRMCDEDTMARERLFLSLLESAQTWEITTEDTLILHGPDGDIKAARQTADPARDDG